MDKSLCIKGSWYVTVPSPTRPDKPASVFGPFGSEQEAQEWLDGKMAKVFGGYTWQCQGVTV